MEAIFSCLGLKPDDRVLPYKMSEIFNKTEHGPTDIIIAWGEFKPVLHPGTNIYCVLECNWRTSTMVGSWKVIAINGKVIRM